MIQNDNKYNNIHTKKHHMGFKMARGYTIKNGATILGSAYIISTGHKQTGAFQVGTPSFIHFVNASTSNMPINTVGITTIILLLII